MNGVILFAKIFAIACATAAEFVAAEIAVKLLSFAFLFFAVAYETETTVEKLDLIKKETRR